MKVHIEWQDNWMRWHHYQTKFNERDAYKVATARTRSTNKRHRLTSESGQLLDLVDT